MEDHLGYQAAASMGSYLNAALRQVDTGQCRIWAFRWQMLATRRTKGENSDRVTILEIYKTEVDLITF